MNFEKLTAYLDDLKNTYGVPGLDIKVMRDHETIYRHQSGCSDYEGKVPMNGSELYDVYSATKVITMTAVMQLVEKGVLNLNDEVSKYLPAFREMQVSDTFDFSVFPPKMPQPGDPTHPAATPIQLWHLMSMTAGMNYDITNPVIVALKEKTDNKASTVEMVSEMAKMPLLYEPGTRYAYSLGHDVMAAVVEITSGEKFETYLENHIFKPLGITDAYMHPGDTEKARMIKQWGMKFGSDEVFPEDSGNRFRLSDNYDCGGAGLTISVDAYSSVVDALACGGVGANGAQILQPETILEMAKPRLNEQQLKDFGRGPMGYSYGLGVRTLIHKEQSRSPIGEFGWDGAAGAFALIDPANHISVFYAQEVLGMIKVYFEVHPAIRDLIYEGLGIE